MSAYLLIIRLLSSGDSAEPTPLRSWNIEIHLLGPRGEELPASCFDKVVYNLHETFNERQIQSTPLVNRTQHVHKADERG